MNTKRFNLPSPLTVLTLIIIALLIYAFFSGISMRLYASVVFLLYSIVGRMWIAVVLLGIFQVIIMIPFRVINLKLSSNINEFKEITENMKSEEEQAFFVQQKMRTGDKTVLYYAIDFIIQTISYISIGRLFLTDFYRFRLDPNLLYDFVPYPSYPIEGRFFLIPYPYFTNTLDLGMKAVLFIWIVLIAALFGIRLIEYIRQQDKQLLQQAINRSAKLKAFIKYFSANMVFVFILSWLLIRHIPTGWKLGIFSGDVSIPNPRFNSITATVTALTVLWFGINKIKRKTDLAVAQNVDQKIIDQTQKDMFKESLRSAIFLGLGAYFITNQIPSAFELSIFSFELIAILSPFTLDKLIIKASQPTQLQNQIEEPETPAPKPVENA